MDDKEVRCLMSGVELRAAAEGSRSPGTLVGYASVFGPLSGELAERPYGRFREKVAPGAFADCLARCDVRGMVNHDPNLLIGRTKSGTLRMAEDGIGLRVENDLPDTQVGRDTAESIRRGDLDGMSFSFTVDKGGDDWDYSGDTPVRTVRKVKDLFDVGPVSFPAYEDTRVAIRSLEANRPAPAPEPAPEPAEAPPPTPVVPDHVLSLAKARQRQAEALLN